MIDYALGLSNDYNKTQSFVSLCNKNALSPVYFREVIKDFLRVYKNIKSSLS